MRAVIVVPLALFAIFLVAAIVVRFGNPATKRDVRFSVGGHEFRVEVADTAAARAQGLSGRDGLPEGEGMLFVFPKAGNYGFWMKDMKFALDFVWIKGDTVLGVTENVPSEPGGNILTYNHYYPPAPADKVLEVNAGTVQNYGIRVGDNARFNL